MVNRKNILLVVISSILISSSLANALDQNVATKLEAIAAKCKDVSLYGLVANQRSFGVRYAADDITSAMLQSKIHEEYELSLRDGTPGNGIIVHPF